MVQKLSGLGKGFDTIFMENNIESENAPILLKLEEIEPNLSQPRVDFNSEKIKELADSISIHGLISPIIVKPMASGKYKIIAGERRYRASKVAGLSEIPVLIRNIDEEKIMEIALVENLQREDLSPLEEAKGYKVLVDTYDFTQEDVAKIIGKSRPYIANTLRLLSLPKYVIESLERKEITAGHARALLGLSSEDDIKRALKITIAQNLNVRQLEELVKKINFKEIDAPKSLKVIKKDAFFNKIESDLHKRLKRKVKIISGRRNKGVIQIEFCGEKDLTSVYSMLSKCSK